MAIGIDVSPREGPARFRAVGSAWLLTPEDTRFAVPVTVSLPLPADYSAVAPLVMLSSPAGAERFEALPTVRRGDVVSARTSHFSVFVAGHQYAADAAPDAGVPADGG